MVHLTSRIAGIVVLGFGLAAATASLAQSGNEMTAAEIASAFEKQMADKQKTRGLVIVPSGQAADDGSETAAVTPAAAESYTAVDKDSQVNVQISFDFDSAALRKDQQPKLATLCQVMKSVDVPVFQIIGHTDSSGSAEYNERLSLLRAKEVKRFLVGNCGIAENRLKAIGMGESAPLDADDPRADINRRVEFQALS